MEEKILSIDPQISSTRQLFRIADRCRTCHATSLVEYLDLGFHPPSDQFRKKEELIFPEVIYPLRVLLCETCGLSQLSHVVDPKVLYQYDYPYESSTTKTGKIHWDTFAECVVKRMGLTAGKNVVDIGSNVGTLLESFRAQGMRVFGVDPASNIVEIANVNGVETICGFFDTKTANQVLEKIGKVDVITGTNVFAHIDDLDAVLENAKSMLYEEGAFIFESPHMKNLIAHFEYDTIYHEHLSYLSLKPVSILAERHQMEVFAVEESEIHGGSFRVYIGHKGKHPVSESVHQMITEEERLGIHSLAVLKEFAKKVQANREKLNWLIEDLLHQGKRIAVVSVPAKGMTLLNYCGLTSRQIEFASEKSKLKIGRYTPGGHIEIVSDAELMTRKPDYALLLAWNFSKEIMANLKEYSDKGGKFIIPVPEPQIV